MYLKFTLYFSGTFGKNLKIQNTPSSQKVFTLNCGVFIFGGDPFPLLGFFHFLGHFLWLSLKMLKNLSERKNFSTVSGGFLLIWVQLQARTFTTWQKLASLILSLLKSISKHSGLMKASLHKILCCISSLGFLFSLFLITSKVVMSKASCWRGEKFLTMPRLWFFSMRKQFLAIIL